MTLCYSYYMQVHLRAETFRFLQPDAIMTSTLEAWYMDCSNEDQRLPHR